MFRIRSLDLRVDWVG